MKETDSDLKRIRRELRKLAFGKSNDCVRLALCDYDDIEKLDLSLLTEIKRSDKGVEVKLLDRTRILAQLAELSSGEEQNEAALALMRALGEENDA